MNHRSRVAVLALASLVFATIALADRTDVWSANSVVVKSVTLVKLADGGCAVAAQADFTKADGGRASEISAMTEVSGVNRTDCLNIIDTRAPVLFKSDKGL